MEGWSWGGVACGNTENLYVSKQECQICGEEVNKYKDEREAERGTRAFSPDRGSRLTVDKLTNLKSIEKQPSASQSTRQYLLEGSEPEPWPKTLTHHNHCKVQL